MLVGPNGSGKSNVLDALAFVRQCLVDSIETAFKSRGGIGAVRRRSGGHPSPIGLRLSMCLDDGLFADYSVEIATGKQERFCVSRERCVVQSRLGPPAAFEVRKGEFTKGIPGIRPRVAPDRMAFYAASATDEFRPVYDFLASMQFYAIAPLRLRELQEPDAGDVLKPDGSNAAAVLRRLQERSPNGAYGRLCRLLARVVDGVQRVEHRAIGQKETIQFRQDVGRKTPLRFDALNMSDGTLRVLGLLLAVYQPGRLSVIGIEEPEATVHPAAADLVTQVLLDASRARQLLVTTHSPDLLDCQSIDDRQIRAVTMERGRTLIATVDPASRAAIRERLYTPGELLRHAELVPNREQAAEGERKLELFGPVLLPNEEASGDAASDR